MTPEILVGLIAMVAAILFDWFPVLAKWFDSLAEGTKRLGMVLLMLVVCLVIFGLGCIDFYATGITCDVVGAKALAVIFVQAIVVNYVTHKTTKPTEAIKEKIF